MTDKDKDKADRPEPLPKRQDFFEWLESLFDGSTQHPEKLEMRIVSGKNLERLGPMIKQIVYGPADYLPTESKKGSGAAGDGGGGSRKPSREKLVMLSNELLYRAQKDCDESRAPHTYAVFASHFARETEFYERWVMRLTPQGVYAKDGAGGAAAVDDEDQPVVKSSISDQWAIQKMQHDERLFNFYGGAIEGVLDRMDRVIERQEQALENLRARYERQQEITERAMSLEAEREAAREWRRLAIKSAEKGIDMAIGMAPPLLNQLIGKKVMPTKESAESIALKNFFKRTEEGGKLTQEQANAAFGLFDDKPPHNMIKPGVMTVAQAKLLWDVANCEVPADDLDKLLPGGALEVTTDQLMKLQGECGFDMDQLAPLAALISARQQRRMEAGKQ